MEIRRSSGYPSTPREYWAARLDEWPEGPRGNAQDIAALCERIRTFLAHH